MRCRAHWPTTARGPADRRATSYPATAARTTRRGRVWRPCSAGARQTSGRQCTSFGRHPDMTMSVSEVDVLRGQCPTVRPPLTFVSHKRRQSMRRLLHSPACTPTTRVPSMCAAPATSAAGAPPLTPSIFPSSRTSFAHPPPPQVTTVTCNSLPLPLFPGQHAPCDQHRGHRPYFESSSSPHYRDLRRGATQDAGSIGNLPRIKAGQSICL